MKAFDKFRTRRWGATEPCSFYTALQDNIVKLILHRKRGRFVMTMTRDEALWISRALAKHAESLEVAECSEMRFSRSE